MVRPGFPGDSIRWEVTRRLNAEEAKLYNEWIANDWRMRRVIEQMRKVAAKAGELKMKDVART